MDKLWRLVHLTTLLAALGSSQMEQAEWSAWSEPSECTRSCGGGVQHETRQCLLQDGTSGICEGPSIRYTSCNTDECRAGTEDFRAAQCRRYNEIRYKEQYYNWLPYTGGANECELNCLAEGSTFFVRFAKKAVDGTPCRPHSNDVCVGGVCQPVGCDRQLGSRTAYDQCRVCGGDGTTCKTVTGNLTTNGLTNGYHDLLLIPASATSITIKEEAASGNHLALRDLTGRFLLNGDLVIDLKQSHDLAGTRFRYTHGDVSKGYSQDELQADGPLTHALIVAVLKQPGTTASILYEYSIPVDASRAASASEYYTWWTGKWADCSAPCAHGTQSREVVCTRSSDGLTVPDNLCDPYRRPASHQACNKQPCQAHWYVGLWEECTAACGTGLQVRTVFCQQATHGDMHVIVSDALCSEKRPSTTQVCHSGTDCPAWTVGPWSKCNRVCGPGQQLRVVRCELEGEELADERCDVDLRPVSAQPCDLQPCEGAEWVVSDWSGCHGTCEQGFETRRVVCSSQEGLIFDDAFCARLEKPATSRSCSENQQCQGVRWFASQWGPCSASCGPGLSSRSVMCAERLNDALRLVDDSLCVEQERPSDQQPCEASQCTGLWYQGPWGKCSRPCDGGERRRSVMCIADEDGFFSAACDQHSRPHEVEGCNSDIPCNDEELMVDCRTLDWGCCEDGVTAAEGPDKLGCPPKDAIPTGSCIEADWGCCLDGLHAATGPFRAGCPKYDCHYTRHGCCDDKQTPKGDAEGSDCPQYVPCNYLLYGCCEDGETPANGPNKAGCEPDSCHKTEFGCCSDDVTPAKDLYGSNCFGGEEMGSGEDEGLADCYNSFYGCCADSITAATGPGKEGCPESTGDCRYTTFGCCPDEKTPAADEHKTGCPGVIVGDQGACRDSAFGCCDDGITPMLDEDGAGCDDGEIVEGTNCVIAKFGCCPDEVTAATGPGFAGCSDTIVTSDCVTSDYGCCPDGATHAQGDHLEGCDGVEQTELDCDKSPHGCCLDGHSVAAGDKFEACPDSEGYEPSCEDTPYKCCRDGKTAARGPNEAGCPWRSAQAAVCALPKERGSCSNYTVMWHFDLSHGDCTRFWYSGCDGNENRFYTREECEGRCMTPPEIDKCYLPEAIGRCADHESRYRFNPETMQCETFLYGGCKGNSNNFKDLASCQKDCVQPQKPEVCSQPQVLGPCRGQFVRWFHDAQSGMCREFIYGGCKGNDNRFDSREACDQRCKMNATQICKLEKDPGPCQAHFEAWYFNKDTLACEPFTFGGCRGNANRFSSQSACEETCHELLPPKEIDICALPREPGTCNLYYERWYFNKESGYCEKFVYGGCEGNDNQFDNEYECRVRCDAKEPINPCTLLNNVGTGSENLIKYFFDTNTGRCREFVYSGQGGNENRFDTLDECHKQCAGTSPVTPPPEAADKCLLPAETGPCLQNVERWYFDSASGACREFVYGGCAGNRNRFMSRELCERDCGDRGASARLTATVPPPRDNRDACEQPVVSGGCHQSLPRWYYDATSGDCGQFLYGGCEGNDNNFATQEACLLRCRRATPEPSGVAVCVLESDGGPCKNDMEKWFPQSVCVMENDRGPCKNDMEKWFYDAEKGRCLPFAYGGCGGNANRFDTEAQCQSACNAQDICALQADIGPCMANKQRYAYNPLLGRCEQFYYGGCRGNANRFLSMETCERVCVSAATTTPAGDVCSLEYDRGSCTEYSIYWYYSAMLGRCQQFYYGSCGGNANRFKTRDECNAFCASTTTTAVVTSTSTPITTSGVVTSTEGVKTRPSLCLKKKETGPCYNYTVLWYFDVTSEDCRRFWYGGCDGNANQFPSQDACKEMCVYARVDVPEEANTPVPTTTIRTTPSPTTTSRTTQTVPSTTRKVVTTTTTTTTSTTTVRKTNPPVVPTKGPCGELQCSLACEHGFARDENDCPVCACVDACQAYECPETHKCVLQDVLCIQAPCDPVPVCIPTPKPGQCPAVPAERPICSVECEHDHNCKGDQKCCDTGCGQICTGPDMPSCVLTVYGCCPDKLTAATGWVFEGCTVSPPQINEHPREVYAKLGETARLLCSTQGVPTPAITWYKNRRPIHPSLLDGRVFIHRDGTLEIRRVTLDDANTYSCRALNLQGVDTRTYILSVQVAPMLSASTPLELYANAGEEVTLDCGVIGGMPSPSVRWLRAGFLVSVDGDRVRENFEEQLVIGGVLAEDGGKYTCEVNNGVGEPLTRTITLHVTAPLAVHIEDQATSYSTGDTLRLRCVANSTTEGAAADVSYTWRKNGNKIPYAENVISAESDVLEISELKKGDSGDYECRATRGSEQASALTSITVSKPASPDQSTDEIPATCVDKPYYADCSLIVRASLCDFPFYGDFCCYSCRKAGLLRRR